MIEYYKQKKAKKDTLDTKRMQEGDENVKESDEKKQVFLREQFGELPMLIADASQFHDVDAWSFVGTERDTPYRKRR